MEKVIELFWEDLSERKQQELLDAGYDDGNVISGVFPVTIIFFDDEEDVE